MLLLSGLLQHHDRSHLEVLQACPERFQPLPMGPVIAIPAVGSDCDEAGVSEHSQMLGGGRASEPSGFGELRRTLLAGADEYQHLPPDGVRDGGDGSIHSWFS